MREVHIAVAVWGEAYVDTMLSLAFPSLLASGNLPACARRANINFFIVTRPEDAQRIREHPTVRSIANLVKVEIEPTVTAELLQEGNRYEVMAACHRSVIRRGVAAGAVLSILSPDCIVADGGLSFCLDRILDGREAVLIAGPRAVLEDLAAELSKHAPAEPGGALMINPRELVRLAVSHPHPISQLLYWDAQPFSQFPSAIYWRAGADSFLARYFHLHPIFVDLAHADKAAGMSGTVDGSLLTMARIRQNRTYVVQRSVDACILELSSRNHDPMGSLPVEVTDKTVHVGQWAWKYADASHRDQFTKFAIRFEGTKQVNWDGVEAAARRDVKAIVSNIQTRIQQTGLERWVKRLAHWLTPGPALFVGYWTWLVSMMLQDAFQGGRKLRWYVRGAYTIWDFPRYFAPSVQEHYSIAIVPWRAQRPGVLLRIAHYLLVKCRIVFVTNVSTGTGHNTVELDYFMRLRLAGRLNRSARYVLLRLPDEFANDTQTLYGTQFWFASTRPLLYNLAAPLIARYADIRLDCGLSRLKWQLREDLSYGPTQAGQSFLYQIKKTENRKAWRSYYQLRAETRNLHPLREGLAIDPDLGLLIGSQPTRIALFHLKFHVMNATAAPSDPARVLPVMQLLSKMGYRLIMIGREKMPAEFAGLGVTDYAGSRLASYRHDLQLIARADLVVTAGSGIALLPDCMGTPLVYLDSWHLGMPMASPLCVMVPSLVRERATGRLLTFEEQLRLYLSREDSGDEVFPSDRYEGCNATSDEIVEAVREVLELARDGLPPTELQQAFRNLDRTGPGVLSGARISRYFVERHAGLLARTAELPRAAIG